VSISRPKFLVVEDHDQRGAVIGLMRHFIPWPRNEEDGWPIYIDIGNSADEILRHASLSTRFKSSDLTALGVIVDADDNFVGRWDSLRRFCVTFFNHVPEDFPADGLILRNDEGKGFGAWIMPDNQSRGMIETFCKLLIPTAGEPIWNFALRTTAQAKDYGAPYRDAHEEKANIHTWLSWQDPPGERMGSAITKKILDPGAESANAFVKWFRKLYGV
jgi:hypothetical protein